ncbi:MAG: NADPH-dependent 7-cyano-7-deazaguanine reductase QueF, partial [Myxococcaceae bacterium]
SLKLYMWSYRNEGAFHEKVTNTIADDIVKAIQPRKLTVVGDFFVRGGIGTIVTVTHDKKK